MSTKRNQIHIKMWEETKCHWLIRKKIHFQSFWCQIKGKRNFTDYSKFTLLKFWHKWAAIQNVLDHVFIDWIPLYDIACSKFCSNMHKCPTFGFNSKIHMSNYLPCQLRNLSFLNQWLWILKVKAINSIVIGVSNFTN